MASSSAVRLVRTTSSSARLSLADAGPWVERLIGFFLNTLPLRLDLSGSPSGKELIDRAKRAALGAFAHQDVPFEKLVEIVAPARRTIDSPLVQVLLTFHSQPRADLNLSGVHVEPEVIPGEVVEIRPQPARQ